MSPRAPEALIEQLWTLHYGRTMHALRRRGVAEEDLDDQATEVFLSLLQRVRDGRETTDDELDAHDGRLPNALFLLARQRAFNYRRARRRSPVHAEEDLSGFDADPAIFDDGRARTLLLELRRCVDDDAWDALVMHRIEGYTYPEMAELLARSERSLKHLVHTAEEALRARLSDSKKGARRP